MLYIIIFKSQLLVVLHSLKLVSMLFLCLLCMSFSHLRPKQAELDLITCNVPDLLRVGLDLLSRHLANPRSISNSPNVIRVPLATSSGTLCHTGQFWQYPLPPDKVQSSHLGIKSLHVFSGWCPVSHSHILCCCHIKLLLTSLLWHAFPSLPASAYTGSSALNVLPPRSY